MPQLPIPFVAIPGEDYFGKVPRWLNPLDERNSRNLKFQERLINEGFVGPFSPEFIQDKRLEFIEQDAELRREASKDFRINDPRKIRATTGQPMRPGSDYVSGNYNSEVMKNIIGYAKKHNIDPYTALAIGLAETNFGASDPNVGHVLHSGPGVAKDTPPEEELVLTFLDKLKYAKRLGKKTPESVVQAYQGYGKIYPTTEQDYHGFKMKSIFGVPIPPGGLDMSQTNLYGKNILDLRDNVLKQNPSVVDLVNTTEKIPLEFPLPTSKKSRSNPVPKFKIVDNTEFGQGGWVYPANTAYPEYGRGGRLTKKGKKRRKYGPRPDYMNQNPSGMTTGPITQRSIGNTPGGGYMSFGEGGNTAYESWYRYNTPEGREGIPDSYSSYDYQRYYNDAVRGLNPMGFDEGSQHFPDTYKYPWHPSFSDESIYYTNQKETPALSYNTKADWKEYLRSKKADGGPVWEIIDDRPMAKNGLFTGMPPADLGIDMGTQRVDVNKDLKIYQTVADKLQAEEVQKDINIVDATDLIDRGKVEEAFRTKYGTSSHKMKYDTRPSYRAEVDKHNREWKGDRIDYPSTDMRSQSYMGNPNLSYMVPEGLTGPARAAYEHSQMGVIGMGVPIPGLQALGELPSVFSLAGKGVKAAKQTLGITKTLTPAEEAAKVISALPSHQQQLIRQAQDLNILPIDFNPKSLDLLFDPSLRSSQKLLENRIRQGIENQLTAVRSVTPPASTLGVAKTSAGRFRELDPRDVQAMKDAGVWGNPLQEALYASTHVPHSNYGMRIGTEALSPKYGSLYHYRGMPIDELGKIDYQYGPYTVKARIPFEYRGEAPQWLEDFKNISVGSLENSGSQLKPGQHAAFGPIDFKSSVEGVSIGYPGQQVLQPISVSYNPTYVAEAAKVKAEIMELQSLYGKPSELLEWASSIKSKEVGRPMKVTDLGEAKNYLNATINDAVMNRYKFITPFSEKTYKVGDPLPELSSLSQAKEEMRLIGSPAKKDASTITFGDPINTPSTSTGLRLEKGLSTRTRSKKSPIWTGQEDVSETLEYVIPGRYSRESALGFQKTLARVNSKIDPEQRIELKSHTLPNGEHAYYFSAYMKDPIEAGKAFKRLEKEIPKGSFIMEPPTGSLSMDSWNSLIRRTRNRDKFQVYPAQHVPLNSAAVHFKLPNQAKAFENNNILLFNNQNDAKEAVQFLNSKMPSNLKAVKARTVFNENLNGFMIEVPNFKLEKLYKKGGQVSRPMYAEGGSTGLNNMPVYKVWESVTNTPWNQAKASNLTTGTAESNLALRKRLLAGEFNDYASAPAPTNFPSPVQLDAAAQASAPKDFNEAFKIARERLGPNQIFEYQGRKYGTNLAGEKFNPSQDTLTAAGLNTPKTKSRLEQQNKMVGSVYSDKVTVKLEPEYQEWEKVKKRQDEINKMDQAEIIRNYHKGSNDQYLILDKSKGKIHLYQGDKAIASYNVGTGMNVGDEQTYTVVKDNKVLWEKGNRMTGAGVYTVAGASAADPHYSNAPTWNFKNEKGISVPMAMHSSFGDRTAKIRDTDPANNRLSNGCINGLCYDLKQLYKQGYNEGDKLYVLPDDPNNKFQISNGKLIFKSENPKVNKTEATLNYKPIKVNFNEKSFMQNVFQFYDFDDENELHRTTLPFIKSLESNKQKVMKAAKINGDIYNELAKMAFGIYGTESNFGDTHTPIVNATKALNKLASKSLKSLGVNYDASSPDYDSKYTTYSRDGNYESVGLTQLKWGYLNATEKKALSELGITSNKDFLDPEKAAMGTVAVLAIRYNEQLTGEQKKDLWKNLPAKWNSRGNYPTRVWNNSRYINILQEDANSGKSASKTVTVPKTNYRTTSTWQLID